MVSRQCIDADVIFVIAEKDAQRNTSCRKEKNVPAHGQDQSPIRDEYLYRRAETELKWAQSADDPKVVRIHYLLAGYYLDRYYADAALAEPHTR